MTGDINKVRALADDQARATIRTDTQRTLFVEAGAGSGKTKMLVERVQQLVLWDGIPMGEIAAVTFTERAGAELRDRLRARLEEAATHSTDVGRRARAEAALEELDTAAIGTLHSFAQRILSEHPIEAGIPPLVEVLDEVGSSAAFESRWTRVRTELLEAEEMAPTFELALAAGITLEHVRSLITKLNSDWDLVAERVVSPGPPPIPRMPDVAVVLAEARRLAAMGVHCTKSEDKFLAKLSGLTQWANLLEPATDDPTAQLAVLKETASLKWGSGVTASWGGRLAEIKGDCTAWQEAVAALVSQVLESTLRSIVYWCGLRVLDAAEARRGDGRLEFHDLLVLTRDLLRDNADVREVLRRRYRRLLLDEFQDTDPIQVEIAVRIAGGAQATQARWEDVIVPPGSLFIVGDPKQSIYRFRRADIAMYLRAQQVLGGDVTLSTNFRSAAPILDWVNAVFGEAISHVPEMQPHYQPLDPYRGAPTAGPGVAVLGATAHPDGVRADALRALEADDVACCIVRALREGWTTEADPSPSTPANDSDADSGGNPSTWRALLPGDIAVLIPARTSLPFLESALERAGVTYRTESSSLVYHAPEVRALFAAARAVADPSDSFALVTTLRSPLFGCGDDDLWTWKQARGSFNLLAPTPEGQQDHPVALAVSYLHDLYRRCQSLTPSQILTALAVDRRMFEVAVYGPRTRDTWRRLRFVIDQARAWSESEHGGLRAYLSWAAAQSAEGSRVAESVLPETDVDSVRIMTVHAAKGLEFPMVVLSGMTSASMSGNGVRLFWTNDGYAVSLSRDLRTGDFQDHVPLDEQMSSHERLRLLYVATTRARDHLVVSLHRSGSRDTNARRLADAHAATAAGALSLPKGALGMPLTQDSSAVDPPPEFAPWLAGVQQSAQASRLQSAMSASGLEGTDPHAESSPPAGAQPPVIEVARGSDTVAAAGIAKGARDVELPAWSKGRYGSAIGRAVHGVLQLVNLSTGEGMQEAVAAQCVAEGVVEFTALVSRLALSVLATDVVKRAAARQHWRESYIGTVQDDGTVLEGFIDLSYREDDGSLVLVDYKTDNAPDAALPSRVVYYAPQLNAYATMLRSATGARVRAPVLVFARETSSRTLTVQNHHP